MFVFVFQLPSLLLSYQPSLIGGLAFFVIATLGALSVIVSFLVALYGAGATAVYSIGNHCILSLTSCQGCGCPVAV